MAPFVHLGVDLQRRGAARMLRNHDLGAALVEVGDDVVAVERLVGDQRAKFNAVDEWRDADGIETLSRQQDESDEVAQGVGEGQDFGCHAALGLADGLVLSPPFAPCPWRWTLTMVASTVLHVRLIRGRIEKPFENIGFYSVSKPLEDTVPRAEQRRQIAPGTAGSRDPQHRFDKASVILTAATGVGFLPPAMRFHFRPLGVGQHISVHPKLESQYLA
jgi:hypothetical protein